jgi:hypothetical protein
MTGRKKRQPICIQPAAATKLYRFRMRSIGRQESGIKVQVDW